MEKAEFDISLLFVEDEKEARESISEMISQEFSKFYVAKNASEALEIHKQNKIDLLLSDVHMPGMNGLELAKIIKQTNPKVKIVMMSAFTDTNFLLQSIDIQVDGYIVKPVRLLRVLSAIKKQADIILSEKKFEEQGQALKQSEDKYRTLIETMSDVVVRISTTGALLYVSPSITNFGGYMANEEIGNNISKYFVKKADYLNVLKLIDDIVITQKNGGFEFMFKPNNKEPFMVELTYMPLIKNGKLYSIQIVLRDITERKKAEAQIKGQNKELQKLNATKDRFFSIIAHDLKGPFNTMLGFSGLLVDKFDKYDKEKQKKFLGILKKDIGNTYKLLENLLHWSRSQRGKIKFKPEKLNLYLLLYETIELLNLMATNKSITIKNEIPENLYVDADNDMLTTIVRNLISNAIKFTPKGGTVEIGVETRHGVSLHGVSQHEIYIKDSGLGIKPEIQTKLFNISENTSTRGTENETGTGLGLILCKEFVEKHGGEIWVESEVGKGSKFIFTLPETV